MNGQAGGPGARLANPNLEKKSVYGPVEELDDEFPSVVPKDRPDGKRIRAV